MKKVLGFMLFCSVLVAEDLLQSRAVIHSLDRTTLSSEIGGKIVYLKKNNGDYFKKNEVLARVDCGVYVAERDKIRVKRDLLRTRYDKNKQLSELNSIGEFEVRTTQLELQEQELALKIASMNVQRCEIKAPFSGRVVEKKANQYQIIRPQEELLEIVGTTSLEVRTIVPAKWLSWIKIGQEATMKVDELGVDVKIKIVQIDQVVDPKSQTIALRARLVSSNSNIIAGMSGTINFNKQKK